MNEQPSWSEYWDTVGNEEYLTARALLELSPTVRGDVENWLRWRHEDAWSDPDTGDEVSAARWPELDWHGWACDVVEHGRPFSGTETRLAQLVAALTTNRPVALVGVLNHLGSWETDVCRILTEWATGGNNRELAGRATAHARRGAD